MMMAAAPRMQAFGMVDKADENLRREVTQEYLNFLDDSVSKRKKGWIQIMEGTFILGRGEGLHRQN
jgi:hypothetical protein